MQAYSMVRDGDRREYLHRVLRTRRPGLSSRPVALAQHGTANRIQGVFLRKFLASVTARPAARDGGSIPGFPTLRILMAPLAVRIPPVRPAPSDRPPPYGASGGTEAAPLSPPAVADPGRSTVGLSTIARFVEQHGASPHHRAGEQRPLFELGHDLHAADASPFSPDLAQLTAVPRRPNQQAPEFFRNAPVGGRSQPPAGAALETFPRCWFGPLRGRPAAHSGVRGGSEQHRETRRLMDLAILRQGLRAPRGRRFASKAGIATAAAAAGRGGPVRARQAAARSRRPRQPAAQRAGTDKPDPVAARAGSESAAARHRPVRSGSAVPEAGSRRPGARQFGRGVDGRRQLHVYGRLRGRAWLA